MPFVYSSEQRLLLKLLQSSHPKNNFQILKLNNKQKKANFQNAGSQSMERRDRNRTTHVWRFPELVPRFSLCLPCSKVKPATLA